MNGHNQRTRISAFGRGLRTLFCGFVVTLALHPNSLRACAACYGQSDAPMARGMNWGIFSLLAVVVVVLGGIAAFFVQLARRSATLAAVPVKPSRGRASVPASPEALGFSTQRGLGGTLGLSRGVAPLLEGSDSVL